MSNERLHRRVFLQLSSCAAGAAALSQLWPGTLRAEDAGLELGPPTPFRFQGLVEEARRRAREPYKAVPTPRPEVMEQMVYDAHEAIHYRPERALFADSPYPVIFRHLGKLFPAPVKMYALEGDSARQVHYRRKLFQIPKGSPALKLPQDAGFAGFSLQRAGAFDPVDKGWLCFLGASYFRGIGESTEMGLSARAVAVNTAPPGKEEFPGYVAFYIRGAQSEHDPVVVHALLDSPSLSGAYRFTVHRAQGVTMEVESRLFLRENIDKLGIAPLTSMFWYGEYGRHHHIDWRPEVHDSDYLMLWTGKGRRVVRALENYRDFSISTFPDQNPKGFGLVQRDRDQNHYLDPVYYERRPSLWIEPLDAWGKGHVELVEIPTVDEYHDNVVAYWVPAKRAAKGTEFAFDYRMHWRNSPPLSTQLARVHGSYIGRGGQPATPDPVGVTKFVIEYRGEVLDRLKSIQELSARSTVSKGTIVDQRLKFVPDTTRVLLEFDVRPSAVKYVELEAYLLKEGKVISERWRYRFEVATGRA